jgi:hypothetical protein
VHNFISTYDEAVPPSDIDNSKATVMVLIWPFVEQQANYDIIANFQNGAAGTLMGFNQDLASSSTGNAGFWINGTHMTTAMRASLSSIPFYLCPSRRAGRQGTSPDGAELPANLPTDPVVGSGSIVAYGPFSDYAPMLYVSFTGTSINRVDGQDFQWVAAHHNNTDNSYAADVEERSTGASYLDRRRVGVGPFRRAVLPSGRNGRNWQPRDTLGWWQDGASNQIIFGEKHIPKGAPLGNDTSAWRHDQSYLCASTSGRDFALGRTACNRYPISIPTTGGDFSQRTFGSWHAGICNFLLGDGAVRAISVSTPGNIMGYLGNTRDGNAVSLP